MRMVVAKKTSSRPSLIYPRPSFPITPLQVYKKHISASKATLTEDGYIVFVCGAKQNRNKPTARDKFLQYAVKHIEDVQFFVAEDIFDVIKKKDPRDLLSLEKKMAGFSDCIVIILESPGANAELGAFALDEDIVEQLLVINDSQYNKKESFINDGPIAKINRRSNFKPVIYTDYNCIVDIMKDVEERLVSRKNDRKKDKLFKIDLSTFGSFITMSNKQRMLFLADLISLYSPVSYHEVIDILKDLYGSGNDYDIRVEMAMLITIGLVKYVDEFYIRTTEKHRMFYQIKSIDSTPLRAEIINYYYRYHRNKANLLMSRVEQ